METREYKLKMKEGNWLLQNSAVLTVPEKVGESVFTTVDRNIIQKLVTTLYDELRAYSPFTQEYEPGKNARMFFGPKDAWEKMTPEGSKWVLKDPEKLISVQLTKDSVLGAAWLSFVCLSTRPSSDRDNGAMAVSPIDATEILWPILKTFRKTESIRDAMGLKKFEEKKHGWADDPVEEEKGKILEFPEKK